MFNTTPDLRMHYVSAGAASRTVVLLHGFPQTWWEWRHVIRPLVDANWRVIAPDYRGAGHSSKPSSGYDKRTMAADVQRLLREHLRIEGPVALVGHDIGLMIAYAYAQEFRNEASHLAIVDAPIPGTAIFERVKANPRVWHFAFHNARDIAEMLIAGREREYLQAFFHTRCFDPSALDLQEYVTAYSAPGSMRAGFELYRAFEQDSEDNRRSLERNGKLKIPTLAVWGAISNSGPLLGQMMNEVADDVTGVQIERAAHWIPEENPTVLAQEVIQFLERTR
ncbi:alpha/beta hydrolase [Acidobacteria bacterium AB60]|nr:alpha/beta hydrolase [Acidobacteria bacterium AB60]